MMINDLKKDLRNAIRPGKAQGLAGFFKTGPGQYGEGDKFLGVMVPDTRVVALRYQELSLGDVAMLLTSAWHEERLTAVLILVAKFQAGDEKIRQEIYKFYLSHISGINNWDLVDASADKIVGAWLLNKKDLLILDKLAKSKNIWERRVAIIASFAFIRNKEYGLTLRLAEMLLDDGHDLMHKAVGWMLREVGKRDKSILVGFLDKHAKTMPRTMLRYAIEKFPEVERKNILNMKNHPHDTSPN